jgi:hypothetical protein
VLGVGRIAFQFDCVDAEPEFDSLMIPSRGLNLTSPPILRKIGLPPENETVRIMGLSDYPKLVPFTLRIRQSGVRNGRQSGACATTHD